ncbi:MAG TPA: chemotaxis protein CheB [Puia sp.]|nr:chemotaxis protein CheB [Puia sp.]
MSPNQNHRTAPTAHNGHRYNFHIIGIGSSAGGLQPLKTIIGDLPPGFPAAVIVVHHAPADGPHQLAEVLRQVSPLPVVEVQTTQRIQPGHVYLPEPGQNVKIRDHILSVEEREPGAKAKRTIDTFFHSLAWDAREKSIGIILSGTDYDGIGGAEAIEAKGGFVIVQDPATAQYPLMPIALIANDNPSFILQPEEISGQIARELGQ